MCVIEKVWDFRPAKKQRIFFLLVRSLFLSLLFAGWYLDRLFFFFTHFGWCYPNSVIQWQPSQKWKGKRFWFWIEIHVSNDVFVGFCGYNWIPLYHLTVFCRQCVNALTIAKYQHIHSHSALTEGWMNETIPTTHKSVSFTVFTWTPLRGLNRKHFHAFPYI